MNETILLDATTFSLKKVFKGEPSPFKANQEHYHQKQSSN